MCTATIVVTLTAVAPAKGATASVQLHSADATGFSVELRLPPPSVVIDPGSGTACSHLQLAPVADGPAPLAGEVSYGWLVGVPEAAGARVEVAAVDEQVWSPPEPLCASGLREGRLRIGADLGGMVASDPAALPFPADLPGSPVPVAHLEPVGDLRGQALVRLVVRPLARTPSGELLLRTRIRLRVNYTDPASGTPALSLEPPFAGLQSSLLNGRFLPAPGNRTTVPARASLPSLDLAAAADPSALRLIVSRDGPTLVTGAELAKAGWTLADVEPAALALTMAGKPVAFTVAGLEEGRFGPRTWIEFQGEAMTGLFTRENVYWLRQGGQSLAPAERNGVPVNPRATVFSETLRLEEDTRWFASLNPGDGDDRWMWGDPLDANNPARRAVTLTVPLANLSPVAAPARLVLRLQGFTADAKVNPDHHVRVLWNDRPLGERRFDGMGVHVLTFTLPAGTLSAGDNRLAVQMLRDTGALVDSVYLNRLALEYLAGFRATDGRLDFASPVTGRATFRLEGFPAPDVVVLDVTDPARPVRFTGVVVTARGSGSYQAEFSDMAPRNARYRAYTPVVPRPVARVEVNQPSDLHAGGTGADYLVLTHPDFAAALEPLVARRAAQGLRTAVVSIQDVYDEFSHGVFDPRAIRAFLQHTYRHWSRPAPLYVLLVGESNFDYRRGYGAGPANFVPSMMREATHGGMDLTAYASDQWFATQGDDDLLPDMLVGRFSVSTAAEAQVVVGKTLRYEDQPADAAWRRLAVLVVDDTDAASLEPFSEELARQVPTGATVARFYAARHPITRSISADIGAAVDAGALVMNFAGHGNVALWSPWTGGGYIFDNAAISRLKNGDAMPVFTAATCMNGWVNHPLKPVSMAELWLTQPSGGGALAWAPSGFTTLGAQHWMFRRIFDGFYDGRGQSFGALAAEAGALALGQSAGYHDVVAMFTLLGDPALTVSGVPVLPTATPTLPPTAVPPTAVPPGIFLPLASQRGQP
jgi:hypothetical protein